MISGGLFAIAVPQFAIFSSNLRFRGPKLPVGSVEFVGVEMFEIQALEILKIHAPIGDSKWLQKRSFEVRWALGPSKN